MQLYCLQFGRLPASHRHSSNLMLFPGHVNSDTRVHFTVNRRTIATRIGAMLFELTVTEVALRYIHYLR